MRAYWKLSGFCMLALLGAACMVPSAQVQANKTPASPSILQPAPRFELETPSVLGEQEPETPASPAAQNTAAPSTTQKSSKTVRVLIAENSKSAYVKHSGRVNIYTQDLSKKYKISPNHLLNNISTHITYGPYFRIFFFILLYPFPC